MRATVALAFVALAACGPAFAADPTPSTTAARFGIAFDGYYVDEVNNDEGTDENGLNPGVNIDTAFGAVSAGGSGAQLDLRGSFYPTARASADDDWTRAFLTGAIHLYMPLHDAGIVGVFGGGGMAKDTGDTDEPQTYWFGGAEMQRAIGDVTYFGQVGYLDGNDEYDEGINQAGFARVGARIFTKPNVSVMAALSGAYGMQDNGDEADSHALIGNIEAEAEYALSAQTSLFASYQGTFVSFDGGMHLADFHDLMIGFRWRPGASDLRSAYEGPASLTLPPVDRWFALTADEVE